MANGASEPHPTSPAPPARITFVGNQCLLPELVYLGWARFRQAQASLSAHVHEKAYEICYIVRGSVDWWVESEVYEVGPGQVYVTRPDERHGGQDAMMHPNELYWAQVIVPAKGLLPGLSGQDSQALRHDLATLQHRTFPGSPAIGDAFARLLAQHQAPGRYSAVLARSALHQLLASVVSDHSHHAQALVEKSAAGSDGIRRALAWIERHLADDYAIEKVAAVAGLSVSHFHAQFLAETGFTPAEYRTRTRINMAKQLLRARKWSITQVAFSVGFSSSQYFATAFKSIVGMKPSEYKGRRSV